MSTDLLQVESLRITSDQGTVLQTISFSLAPGEIVALTGRSGSGKTSLALAVLGMLPPGLKHTSGMIRWSAPGQPAMVLPADLDQWKGLRGLHIGYTQQDVFSVFDPVISMGKQMVMAASERTRRTAREIEGELRILMEEVGLHAIDRLWSSYPHQLSGGQLQRCQICLALVMKPEMIIADEPTSAIDKINQLELLDVFAMLRERYQLAILCITHEASVVHYLADREVSLEGEAADSRLAVLRRDTEDLISGEPVLAARQLTYTHRYGNMRFHRGALIGPIDISIRAGSCLGIIGESGSGKSTLAQMLVGLSRPVSGEILLQGRPVDFLMPGAVANLRSKVQLVMQDGRGSLHPNYNIGHLLEEVAARQRHENPAYTMKVADILREVGLSEDMLQRKPSRLSGGECLRVSIARALLLEPAVLICDESTAGLDPVTRDQILSMLLNLMHSRQLALVMISHDEHIIRAMAGEIVVMADGKVVEKGPADQVVRYPTNPATKKIFTSYATFRGKRNP